MEIVEIERASNATRDVRLRMIANANNDEQALVRTAQYTARSRPPAVKTMKRGAARAFAD
jgi:hypothetical protein